MSCRIFPTEGKYCYPYCPQMSDSDDDVPKLSAGTFAALQEFYAQEMKREQILTQLEEDNQLCGNIIFDENWQLSQFWYDDQTVQSLVKVVSTFLPDNGSVALISCPTLFTPIRRQLLERGNVMLLEFDKRFEIHYPNFTFYDYNEPEKLPQNMIKNYDIIIADPPFLSEECIEKTAKTIKMLAKDKIIICTGTVMKDLVENLLGLKICEFTPTHRNNLANQFSCYANFDLDSILR